MPGALKGVCVLDLSRVLAGPWATMTLADLGAEVIKVEQPGCGDDTRAWGPPFATTADGRPGDAAYFLSANRGKRSVTIDFATADGQQLIRRLSERADVLVENFKVNTLSRYGLDYPALAAVNPRLVYCSITGFGQTGPYRDQAGYDFLIQGLSGLMSITGERDGPPMKVGVAVSDVLTGLYATVAILAALAERHDSGRGQYIDLALFDVQVAALANQALNFLVSETAPSRLGNAHPNIVPYQVFAVADGHIILAVGNDRQFARFCAVAGCPELATDPLYATNAARVAHRVTLTERLAPILTARSQAVWLRELAMAGVPSSPINTIDAVFEDPQIAARRMRLELPYDGGRAPSVACPIHLSRSTIDELRGPPRLGADTEAVLREKLGLSDAELARLRALAVI